MNPPPRFSILASNHSLTYKIILSSLLLINSNKKLGGIKSGYFLETIFPLIDYVCCPGRKLEGDGCTTASLTPCFALGQLVAEREEVSLSAGEPACLLGYS